MAGKQPCVFMNNSSFCFAMEKVAERNIAQNKWLCAAHYLQKCAMSEKSIYLCPRLCTGKAHF